MIKPRIHWEPKAGSSRAEYEDAIGWSPRRGRFAVADGASASAFARLWAQLLVRAYVAGRLTADGLEQDLAPLQACWCADVENRDLPWYAVEQVRRGAFAALVGLTINPDGTWRSLAIGDCCLFQLRDGALLTAVPIDDPDAFDNRPLLLGSRPVANTRLRTEGAIVTAGGSWQPGDTFLLISDALAATLLRHRCVPDQRSTRGFRRWVQRMREQRLLRNDDVSLLALVMPAGAPA